MIRAVVFLISLAVSNAAYHWGYGQNNGPDTWASHGFSVCGSKTRQSPININTWSVSESSRLGAFKFSSAYKSDDDDDAKWTMSNNGHSVNVDTTGSYQVSGGGLSSAYNLAGFHFHWGSSDSRGSEHTLNNKRYPMEMHMVHFKASLGSLSNAAQVTPDGLAVLGFFFEVQRHDNHRLNSIIKKLASVRNPEQSTSMSPVSLMGILPKDLAWYYRYSGSLTTPGCYESVQWTLFHQTIKISERQLNEFRKLKDATHSALVNNYRKTQNPNGGRSVYMPKGMRNVIG